ncbi:MAG TPA: ABC transporter permease, partial [Verrucomicrobiae bacterium]
MSAARSRPLLLALNHATLILFALVLAVFSMLSPKFFTGGNLVNLLVQSSSTAVVGIGMTFVLLTAGVDLSVGAIMFVSAGIAGKLLLSGSSLPVALFVIVGVGLLFGLVNALLITRLSIIAFIATLGTLYVGRGFGLWLTETRAMNLPESFLHIGTARWLTVP